MPCNAAYLIAAKAKGSSSRMLLLLKYRWQQHINSLVGIIFKILPSKYDYRINRWCDISGAYRPKSKPEDRIVHYEWKRSVSMLRWQMNSKSNQYSSLYIYNYIIYNSILYMYTVLVYTLQLDFVHFPVFYSAYYCTVLVRVIEWASAGCLCSTWKMLWRHQIKSAFFLWRNFQSLSVNCP